MAFYDINGNLLDSAFDISGNLLGKSKDDYRDDRLLIYEDNFSSLDENIWTLEVGPMRGNAFFRRNNISVENDTLCLIAKLESHAGKDVTNGCLTSRGKRSWGYGRFDVKAKMSGLSPFNCAFWFMGDNLRESWWNDDGTRDYTRQTDGVENSTHWSACGEIDVVETIPGNTTRPQCNLFYDDQTGAGYGEFPSDIDTTKWHIYSMEWTSQFIKMYIDDTLYKTWTFASLDYSKLSAYINRPMAIYFSIAGPSQTGTSIPTEGKMYVDWIRVYAEEGVNTPIEAQSIQIQETLRLKKGYFVYTSPVISPINTSDRSVIWASSNESIVTCDTGFIYGIEIGEADVYAITKNGKISKCHVTVIDPSEEVVLA